MPNKKYTVIVSDKAASMLVNHVRFLARVSPEAAKKLHKEILPKQEPWNICRKAIRGLTVMRFLPINTERSLCQKGTY